MPNANQNTAVRQESEAPVETAEMLGGQVLSLLPTLRLHSVSLFDAKGDIQWLSEGALGPDEQGVVEEAIATLSAATSRAHLESSLADSRAALFLAVRTPRATLAGVIMVLMDAKLLSSGNLAAPHSYHGHAFGPAEDRDAAGAAAAAGGHRDLRWHPTVFDPARCRWKWRWFVALAWVTRPTGPRPCSRRLRHLDDVLALEILEPPVVADPASTNDLLTWDTPEIAALAVEVAFDSAESAEIAFDAEPTAVPQTTDEVQALAGPQVHADASSDADAPVTATAGIDPLACRPAAARVATRSSRSPKSSVAMHWPRSTSC